jgi:hypothetical protein
MMPRTNRRALTIAAIAAAIVLVAGVAAAFALSTPGRSQQVAGVPPLATGLPLTQSPTSVALAPDPLAQGGPQAPTPKPSKPAASPSGAKTGSAGSVTGSSKGGGTSAGATAGSRPPSSGSAAAGSRHTSSDGEHRETVKPRVRDEHTDKHHD